MATAVVSTLEYKAPGCIAGLFGLLRLLGLLVLLDLLGLLISE